MLLTQIFDLCLKKWGLNSQLLMLAEESSELSVATLHLFRVNKGETMENFCEEIADVELMIEEIKYYFRKNSVEQKIAFWRKVKIKKLKKLLAQNNCSVNSN